MGEVNYVYGVDILLSKPAKRCIRRFTRRICRAWRGYIMKKSGRYGVCLEILFVVVLVIYPLRHINWGLDL